MSSVTNLHRSSQNFLILISQFQSLENFSLLFNKSSDFSLFIETTIKLNYNKYFQTQENRFKFINKDINQLILTLCESKNLFKNLQKRTLLPNGKLHL